MALSTPTYQIQVSFTDPYDTPDFVDITRWVKKGTTKRGRQHELQRAVAGTCALTITNQDGRFSTFNTTSPYVNVMTGADSYFSGQTVGSTAPGTWGNTSNCALLLTASQGYDGLPALAMTSSAAGNMTASTATGIAGYSVTAGKIYGFQAQFKTAVSARACSVGVSWFNSGGTIIGSTTFGSTVNDAPSVYSKALLSATAPAGATTCALVVRVASTGAANEKHYVTRLMISNADSHGNVSTAWAPGGRGLVPARPVKVTATSGSVFPVFYGYVDSWLPSYGVALSDQVLNCSDGLTLLALSYITNSAYSAQIIADGAVGYWRLGDAVGAPSVADSSGHGASMTCGHEVTLGTPGLLSSDTTTSATIADNGNYYTIPAAWPAIGLKGTGTYSASGTGCTIECIAQSSTLLAAGAGFCVLFGLADPTGTNGFGLTTGGSGVQPVADVFSGGGGVATGPGSINDGHPHHLVGTWSAAGAVRLYVDGVLAASASGTGPTAAALTPASFWTNGAAASFVLDECAVYTSVLSASQVALHNSLFVSGFTQQQSGQRIAAVLNALGVPASLQNIATGISAVQAPTSSLNTTPALSYIQTVENTEQGFFYVDEAGIFTYRDRHYVVQNSAALTSNGTFANDTNVGHFKFQAGSLIPAEDALDLWNDWPVSAITNAPIGVTGAIQNAPNPDSQRWYGKRTGQGYQSMLQTSDAEALALSQWQIAHYGLPVARVRQMKLDSTASSPSSLPQMLGRKLLDRVTINWQPMDGTAIPLSQDSLVESIQHDFGPALWTTTWGLSVAEAQNYFTLNDAVRGTLAATGATTGNRLGF